MRLLRRSWVTTGLALTLGVLVGAVVVFSLADIAFPFGPRVRVAALVLVAGSTLYTFLVGVLRPYRRRVTKVQVARRIEKQLPNSHNRLVSCIDLADTPGLRSYSMAFFNRLVSEVLELVRHFRPRRVIDYHSLRRAELIAVAAMAVFVVMIIFFPRPVTTAMVRIFAPLSDVPPSTGVSFSVSPGNTEALRGDPVTFAAQVRRGRPDDLRLRVKPVGGGASRWYVMEKREPGRWCVTLTGLEESVRYRVHGGGTWSRQFTITLLDRPWLERVQTVLHYPEYMGLDEPQVSPPHALEVAGPEGSVIEVVVDVGGDVSEGEVQLLRTRTVSSDEQGEGGQFEVAATYAIRPREGNRWTGRFPLDDTGFFRVEVRNALGQANKPMQEVKYMALPDEPPQVVLEQPGRDLVVSEAVDVPLVMAVYDDFALEKIAVVVEVASRGEPTVLPIRQYDAPPRSDTVLTSLDLVAMNLFEGDEVTGYVMVEDRAGQLGLSREFTVRILADDNATDLRLAAFEKTEDAFEEKLLKLVMATSGVYREFEKMTVTYAPLTEVLDSVRVDGVAEEPPALLEALRGDIARLADYAGANVKLAQELEGDMAKALEQMGDIAILPGPIVGMMQSLQLAYQDLALGPMTELGQLVAEAPEGEETLPDLKAMLELSEDLQHGLDSVQSQFKALARARAGLLEDVERAVAELEGQMLEEHASIGERRLTDLQEFVAGMRERFNALQSEQAELMAQVVESDAEHLAGLEARQQELEAEAKSRLREARVLLNTEELLRQLRLGRAPEFPDAPYAPETAEYYVPPSEEDFEEPIEEEPPAESEEQPEDEKNGEDEEKDKEVEDEDEPPLYLPALGGRRAVLDPRFARMRRPVAANDKDNADAPTDDPAREFATRQQQLLDELAMASQSLGADHQSLQNILEQLRQLTTDDWQLMTDDRPRSRNLGQFLWSPSTQQALAMSGRMRRLRRAAVAPQNRDAQVATPVAVPAVPAYLADPALRTDNWQLATDSMAGTVPPATRRVILRMQPKQREELLQGMREEGPEGYHRFIQDYFKRLARIRRRP